MMGVGWAYCPICGKRFEGHYYPRTGANTAVYRVERHLLIRHQKKIVSNRVVDIDREDIVQERFYLDRVKRLKDFTTENAVVMTAYCYICQSYIVNKTLREKDIVREIGWGAEDIVTFGYKGSKLVVQNWTKGEIVDVEEFFRERFVSEIREHFEQHHPEFLRYFI